MTTRADIEQATRQFLASGHTITKPHTGYDVAGREAITANPVRRKQWEVGWGDHVGGMFTADLCDWLARAPRTSPDRARAFVTYRGVTQSVDEWVHELSRKGIQITPAMLRYRLQEAQWPVARALTLPRQPRGAHLVGKPSTFSGRTHTTESKAKMSAALKGIVFTDSRRAKLSHARKGKQAWNKGVTPSAATRALWSAQRKGRAAWNKGQAWSPEVREKLRSAHLGKPLSAAHRANCQKAQQTRRLRERNARSQETHSHNS